MSTLKTLYNYMKSQAEAVNDNNALRTLHRVIEAEVAYNGVGEGSGAVKLPFHMPYGVTVPNAKHIARSLLINDVNDNERRANVKRIELEDGQYHTLPQKDSKIRSYYYQETSHVLKNANKCLNALKKFKPTDYVYLSSKDSLPYKVTAKFVRKFTGHDLGLIARHLNAGKPEQMDLFATV